MSHTKKKTIRRGLTRHEKDNKRKIADGVKAYLEREVWPHISPELRGKRITKLEEEEILGIGPDGCPT